MNSGRNRDYHALHEVRSRQSGGSPALGNRLQQFTARHGRQTPQAVDSRRRLLNSGGPECAWWVLKLQVFISYGYACPHSRELIASLKGHLDQQYEFLIDEEQLWTGDDVPARIASWLNACHAAVLLLSEAAFASDWVAKEIERLCIRRQSGARLPILPIGVAVGDRSATWKRVKESSRLAFSGKLGLYDVVCEGVRDGKPASAHELVNLVRRGLPPSPCNARQRAVSYVEEALLHGGNVQLREAWTHLGEAVDVTPPDALAPRLAASLMMAGPELAATALRPLTAYPLTAEAVRHIWQRIEPYWLDERISHDFVEYLRSNDAAGTLLLPATESDTVRALQRQVDDLLFGLDQPLWLPVVRPTDAIGHRWLSEAVHRQLDADPATLMEDMTYLARAGIRMGRHAVVLLGPAEPEAIQDFRRTYSTFVLLIVTRSAPYYPPSLACYRLHPELAEEDERKAITQLRLAHRRLAAAGVRLC